MIVQQFADLPAAAPESRSVLTHPGLSWKRGE